MRHFVLPSGYEGQEEFDLPADDAHYLRSVLRLKVGDSLPGRDRAGGAYHLTVIFASDTTTRLRVQKKGIPQSGGDGDALLPRLALYQCLPKGAKFDEIVRRATEIGVVSITPVTSAYSIPRLADESRRRSKMGRWNRIIRQAAQQSGTERVPELLPPRALGDLEDLIDETAAVDGLFFHQEPLAEKSLHDYLWQAAEEIRLVIGPEGGFSDEEVSMLGQKGYNPAYLGPQVLRTETAAIYALAAVHTILLERATWRLRKPTG